MNLTKGLTAELRHDVLLLVYCFAHDALTYTGAMRRAVGGEVLAHLHDKATDAAAVAKAAIKSIERAHPEVFTSRAGNFS